MDPITDEKIESFCEVFPHSMPSDDESFINSSSNESLDHSDNKHFFPINNSKTRMPRPAPSSSDESSSNHFLSPHSAVTQISKKSKKRKLPPINEEVLKDRFTCNVCGKSFNHKHHIIKHCRIHTDEKPYIFKAVTQTSKKSKKRKLPPINEEVLKDCFTCNVCGESFNHKHHIVRHCRIHTDEKPYKCKVCGKLFRDQSNLQNHQRTHTAEKPFQCVICGKRFRRNDHLFVHYRTHNHKTPYKCNLCEKSFTTNGNLTRHTKKIHQ